MENKVSSPKLSPSKAIFLLPALHLCLCLAIQIGLIPNSVEWGVWFYIFLLDFPASVLSLFLGYIALPFIAFRGLGHLAGCNVTRRYLKNTFL
jgi:hypothetical protein